MKDKKKKSNAGRKKVVIDYDQACFDSGYTWKKSETLFHEWLIKLNRR